MQPFPNYAFSSPSRVGKVLLLQSVIVYDRYIYPWVSYTLLNQSNREIFRNFELTYCPLNLARQLLYFTMEFSYMYYYS